MSGNREDHYTCPRCQTTFRVGAPSDSVLVICPARDCGRKQWMLGRQACTDEAPGLGTAQFSTCVGRLYDGAEEVLAGPAAELGQFAADLNANPPGPGELARRLLELIQATRGCSFGPGAALVEAYPPRLLGRGRLP